MNSLNVVMLVVVAVSKFSRAVVVSCAIYVNSDMSLITAPQISTFAAYACVPELASYLCNSLNDQAK